MTFPIFRIFLILFLIANSLLDSYFSSTAWDLLKNGFLVAGIAIVLYCYDLFKHKNSTSIEKPIIFFLLSIFTIIYIYTQGLIHLPASDIPNQKFYIRFLFYISLLVLFFYYVRKKNQVLFWITIVSTLVLTNVWGFLLNGSGYGILVLYTLSIGFSKRFDIFPSSLAYLLFLLIGTVGYFFQDFKSYFFPGLFVYVLVFLVFSNVHLESNKMIRKILKYYLHFFLVSAIVFLTFYFLQGTLSNDNRSLGSFQVNSVGGSILFFFPLFFFFLNKRYLTTNTYGFQSVFQWIYLISLPAVTYLLYISHTRSAIIAISFFIAYAFYLILRRNKYKKIIFFTSGFIFIGLIPFVIDYFLNSKSIITLLIRLDIWKSYIDITFFEKPFLGFGFNAQNMITNIPESFKYFHHHPLVYQEMENTGGTPHSHNLFVQIILERGFIGFFFWIGFLYLLFTESIFRKGKTTISARFSKIVLFSFLIHQSFDYTLQDPNVLLGLAILVGIVQRSSFPIFRFDFKNTHYLMRITGLVLGLFLMGIIWILNVNHKQSLVFQEYFHRDNFQKLKETKPMNEDGKGKSRFLDILTNGIYLDDKMAYYSGFVFHLLAKEKPGNDEYQKARDERLSTCSRLNPYNDQCNSFDLDE